MSSTWLLIVMSLSTLTESQEYTGSFRRGFAVHQAYMLIVRIKLTRVSFILFFSVCVCHKSEFRSTDLSLSVFSKFGYLQRLRYTFSHGTSYQPLGVEKFATAISRMRCQETCQRSSLLTTLTTVDAGRAHAYLHVHRLQCLSSIYFDLLQMCCATLSYSCAAVNKISTDSAQRQQSFLYTVFGLLVTVAILF